MKTTARDIMSPHFHTPTPDTPLNEAVKMFQQASREEGRKIFGMMVTNDARRIKIETCGFIQLTGDRPE